MTKNTNSIKPDAIRLTSSRKAHPEDLLKGDYVAVASMKYDLPSFLWCGLDHMAYPPDQTIDVTFIPCADDNTPLQVKSICLPLVLCKSKDGEHRLIDLRQTTLLKLDCTFAKETCKSLSDKRGSKLAENGSQGSVRKNGKRQNGKRKKKRR